MAGGAKPSDKDANEDIQNENVTTPDNERSVCLSRRDYYDVIQSKSSQFLSVAFLLSQTESV